MPKRHWIPIVLIVLGAWLTAGCFYLPVFEHGDNKNQKDFRRLVGHAKSRQPIREGAITRQQVADLLGIAPYVSADRTALGYSYVTTRGMWVYPLCFTTTEGTERQYILRLIFDEHDILRRWDIEHEDGDHDVFLDNSTHWEDKAIKRLNQTGPELLPRGYQYHPPTGIGRDPATVPSTPR
jgi:hypothetical protein